MNKRIKIYSILLATIYIFIVGYEMTSQFDDFAYSFMQGANSAHSEKRGFSSETFELKVSPKAGRNTFSDNLINLKNKETIEAESSVIKVNIEHPIKDRSVLIVILDGLFLLCAFFALIIIVYIPILFLQIIHPLAKGEFLMADLVRRTRRMGCMLLIFNLFSFLFGTYRSYILATQLIECEKYDINFYIEDYSMLVLGIIALLVSEILRASLKMKEEQDLTI